MSGSILSSTLETGLIYGLLLFAISYAYIEEYQTVSTQKLRFIGLYTVLFTILYGACVFFIPAFSGYYAYLCMLLAGTMLFIQCRVRSRRINVIVFLVSLLLLLTSLKGALALLMLAQLADKVPYITLWYEILYIAFALLCTGYYAKHAFHFPKQTTRSYYIIMAVLPLICALSSHAVMESTIGAGSAVTWILGFNAVMNLLIIFFVYYLSYSISNTYDRLLQSRQINQKLELQLDHLDRNTAMIEQIRRDKHELKNVYFYIESLLAQDKIEELKNFVSEKLVRRYERLEEFNTGNTMMDYLLTQKVNEARYEQIHTMSNIVVPEKLNIDDADLCAILVNLLDNAIDASKLEAPRDRDIQITIRTHMNQLSILIKNKVSHNILEDNPQLKTIKSDAQYHGIGLSVIRSVVKRYNGISDHYMENGYFCAHIVLFLS